MIEVWTFSIVKAHACGGGIGRMSQLLFKEIMPSRMKSAYFRSSCCTLAVTKANRKNGRIELYFNQWLPFTL